MVDLPLVMSPTGPLPVAPAAIRNDIDQDVKATNPDYTSNLPGSLIEDILSTDVAAVVESDQFFVDLVNSITPYGANPFLLTLLGQVYGIQQGQATNTSVFVTFKCVNAADGTTPVPGVVIGQGFIVSDGTYQYICPEGGIIGTDGFSLPIYAVATMPGSWGIPIDTVIFLVSGSPTTDIILTVMNNEVGIPATSDESITQYRGRVLDAGLASSTGMQRYLKTLLKTVIGVQSRLVSIQQDLIRQGWYIIVGGGDPYQVGNAISKGLFDISTILSGAINISNIQKTNPCIVTTASRHNLTTGQLELFQNILGMTELNGFKYAVTVTDPWNFHIPVNATGFSTYISGGILTPNPIAIDVGISDYPDLYQITYINPPQELTSIAILWAARPNFFVSEPAVAQLANPAIVGYINGLNAGSDPIHLDNMRSIFQTAVASILPSQFINSINISVSIDGVGVFPETDTDVIPGDPFSYFYTTSNLVVINRAV